MKSLIISDIHNRIHFVDDLIRLTQPDEVIFLGDYFDHHGDDEHDAHEVALWIRARIFLDGYIFLIGNHESQYRWPTCNWHRTCAYTANKQKAIDAVLKPEHWKRMKFAAQRGNWWMTHAGLHPQIFSSPTGGVHPPSIWEKFEEAETHCDNGHFTHITDECMEEGQLPSGPLWLRWRNFQPIPGIHQIMGHSPVEEPQTWEEGEPSQPHAWTRNINLDSQNRHYAILDGEELQIAENPHYRGWKKETRPPDNVGDLAMSS